MMPVELEKTTNNISDSIRSWIGDVSANLVERVFGDRPRVGLWIGIPLWVVARGYLKQRLSKCGFDAVPSECVNEFVRFAARRNVNPGDMGADIFPALDYVLSVFQLWRKSPGHQLFQDCGPLKNYYRDTFERYGVR